MSQWNSYDILIQCVVHLSTCVHGSFQDWFQFPLRISIMSTALERWNLNASEFFVLVFAVFVFCFNSCNLWSSCLPNWQGGGCSTSSCEHVGNSRISSILAESWPKSASRQHRKKRAGVLVQIQNWVSSVWKEKISSKVTAASVDMLLRSHEFSLGVCPSHVRATLVRATHARATLVLCIQSHINATLTGLNSYWMRQRFQFERSWGQIQSEQQQQIYTKPYGFFRSTIQDNSNYPFQTVYVGTFKNYSPHMAYNCRFNCNCWQLALR